MKKKLKQIAATSLALITILGAVGCGSSATDAVATDAGTAEVSETSGASDTVDSTVSGEITEVKMILGDIYSMTGTQEVQDAINEIIEPKYGLRFEITWVPLGNLVQQTNLVLTGDEVDVFQGFGMLTYINNGQAVDLTDYLANTDNEEMKTLFSDNLIEGCSVDGRLYGLPKVVDYGHEFGLNIEENIAAEYVSCGRLW